MQLWNRDGNGHGTHVAGIVKSVTENVIKHSPEAIIIIVSNPLDVMTYQAHITSGLPRTKLMGMAGILDTARYRAFLAEALNVSPKDIQAILMGGHGDTMLPIRSACRIGGMPVEKFVKAGGKIYVCTPCMKKRGITEDNLIEGATPAGGAALVEWLASGSPCVAY